MHPGAQTPPFEISGELQYRPTHPDLNDCLARADANRPVIKAREKDIEIEDHQVRSGPERNAPTRPRLLRV